MHHRTHYVRHAIHRVQDGVRFVGKIGVCLVVLSSFVYLYLLILGVFGAGHTAAHP